MLESQLDTRVQASSDMMGTIGQENSTEESNHDPLGETCCELHHANDQVDDEEYDDIAAIGHSIGNQNELIPKDPHLKV